MNRVPLDLPEHTFETDGIWFEISPLVQTEAESQYLHFMGGIHAMEHAAIGMFPLIVMTDRNDLGGISIPYHPQVGSAAVFIYDGIPGGPGLCRQAFHRAKDLLDVTLRAIQTCSCETGCPSCVHSPKCGSGNRPIDKASAIFILKVLLQMPVDAVAMQNSAFHVVEPGCVHDGHSGNGKDDDTRESGPAVPLSHKKRSKNDGTKVLPALIL